RRPGVRARSRGGRASLPKVLLQLFPRSARQAGRRRGTGGCHPTRARPFFISEKRVSGLAVAEIAVSAQVSRCPIRRAVHLARPDFAVSQPRADAGACAPWRAANRYCLEDFMERTTLGPLTVSTLSLGAMLFGTKTPEDLSRKMLDRFAEAGGNFIDTSNN